MSNFEDLAAYVFCLEIIDTHEHVPGNEPKRNAQADVLSEYLIHYFSCDLVSAGLKPQELEQARDTKKPLAERWKLVEPYWQAARNTGYGRSLDIAARDLYGIELIDRETIGPLNDAFVKARASGTWYQTVLKEKCRIRLSILDSDLDCDRRFFRSTVRLDDFVMAASAADLASLARRAGVSEIHTLTDLLEACEKTLDEALARGAVCLKSGLAYSRSLRYEKTTMAQAEQDFCALRQERNWSGGLKGYSGKLQDYMMHHILRLTDRRGLTFQFHTGLQEGNGNYIYHSDPSLLSNLFLEYADVKFDCFHIGYPYQQTLSALAKNFRNVFIDFCWAHIISPTAAVNALLECLDAVPANKISGFGGDYCFVDGIYGHQCIARENIARALAIKVEHGCFDLSRAKEIASMLLHDNPKAIFNLDAAMAEEPKPKHRPKKT